jgi:hypothetical protein
MTNSELDVVRAGVVIARLRVTTVEDISSAADIIPHSLADGETLRSGNEILIVN